MNPVIATPAPYPGNVYVTNPSVYPYCDPAVDPTCVLPYYASSLAYPYYYSAYAYRYVPRGGYYSFYGKPGTVNVNRVGLQGRQGTFSGARTGIAASGRTGGVGDRFGTGKRPSGVGGTRGAATGRRAAGAAGGRGGGRRR